MTQKKIQYAAAHAFYSIARNMQGLAVTYTSYPVHNIVVPRRYDARHSSRRNVRKIEDDV